MFFRSSNKIHLGAGEFAFVRKKGIKAINISFTVNVLSNSDIIQGTNTC